LFELTQAKYLCPLQKAASLAIPKDVLYSATGLPAAAIVEVMKS